MNFIQQSSSAVLSLSGSGGLGIDTMILIAVGMPFLILGGLNCFLGKKLFAYLHAIVCGLWGFGFVEGLL